MEKLLRTVLALWKSSFPLSSILWWLDLVRPTVLSLGIALCCENSTNISLFPTAFRVRPRTAHWGHFWQTLNFADVWQHTPTLFPMMWLRSLTPNFCTYPARHLNISSWKWILRRSHPNLCEASLRMQQETAEACFTKENQCLSLIRKPRLSSRKMILSYVPVITYASLNDSNFSVS